MTMTQIEAIRNSIAAMNGTTLDSSILAETISVMNNILSAKEKQASTPRKPSAADTARLAENEAIRANIMVALEKLDRAVTAAEILAECPNLFVGVTSPRLVSNLAILKRDGKIVTEIIKRHTYYSTPMVV